MTQEEKQLLSIDLCARLPYKPHIYIKEGKVDIDVDTILNATYIHDWLTVPSCQNITITPYLRPMSSMTEEEKDEYDRLVMCNASWIVDDWLNKNHFDYRRLIPMGLALEAKEGMYKTK